jgi:very-short-patch-repair endonuclease
MGHNLDRRIGVVAAKQHGVFTRTQALNVGFTPEQVDYRVEIGRWIVLAAGLYSIAGAVVNWEGRVMGAVLLSDPGSAASHRTASSLWQVLPRAAGPVEILTSLDGYHGVLEGRVVRRAMHLGPRDVRRIGPIPVTSPARTLVDLAGVVTPNELEAALDEFAGLRLIPVNAIRTYIADRHLEHRAGAGELRELLKDRAEGVPQKELERRFLRLVRTYGLPRPVRQQPSGPSKIDFAYPELMIAIEVDGWNSHGTPRALDSDLHRQNGLVLRRWTIMRFTWKQITEEPDVVAAEIRLAIEQARADGRRRAPIRS